MRIPLELDHLLKTSLPENTQAQTSNPQTAQAQTPNPQAAQTSLAGRLEAIEARKALEVEHYLRACALRLDLPDGGCPGVQRGAEVDGGVRH